MNNSIVRVHRPELTQEERARRMKQIALAAEAVLKEREKKRETHK